MFARLLTTRLVDILQQDLFRRKFVITLIINIKWKKQPGYFYLLLLTCMKNYLPTCFGLNLFAKWFMSLLKANVLQFQFHVILRKNSYSGLIFNQDWRSSKLIVALKAITSALPGKKWRFNCQVFIISRCRIFFETKQVDLFAHLIDSDKRNILADFDASALSSQRATWKFMMLHTDN